MAVDGEDMRKKWLIISIVVVVLVVASISVFLVLRHRQLMTDIKNHYATVVQLNKGSKLYAKDKNKYVHIGEAKQNIVINLKKQTKSSDRYYAVEDSDFYVYYKDVKPLTKQNELSNYYMELGQVKTKKVELYFCDSNKLALVINKPLTLSVIKKYDEGYEVIYLNNIYYLKKGDETFIEKDNVENVEAISVFSLADDLQEGKMTELLQKLQEKSYRTITIQDLVYWNKQQIKLPNNVVVLKKNSCDDTCQNLLKNYGFSLSEVINDIEFYDGDRQNKIGEDTYYQYVIDNNTTVQRIEDMLNGVELPKPVYHTSSGEQEIAVLNYHFFYSPAIGENCNESICLDTAKFEEQLQYLKNNGYKTLTIHEFQKWMYNEIELPDKSVLLTIDDGAMGTGVHNGNKLIPLLEKYQMHATLFLITGWWGIDNYRSAYLDVQSHTHDMHQEGVCSNQTRGAKMLCSTKEEMLQDLTLSASITNDKTSFCFPFYASNNISIEALQEVGYKIAFVGGNKRAKRSNNKYQIPRYPIFNDISLNEFISMLG